MKHEIYWHRNVTIFKTGNGWTLDFGYDFNIYKTLRDAKAAIDKGLDGTNTSEPQIIGEQKLVGEKLENIYF